MVCCIVGSAPASSTDAQQQSYIYKSYLANVHLEEGAWLTTRKAGKDVGGGL